MQMSFVSQVLLNILIFDFGGIGNSNIGSLFKNEWVYTCSVLGLCLERKLGLTGIFVIDTGNDF